MSTPKDRLHVVYDSYSAAYRRRPEDLKAASTAGQAQSVLDNVDSLESSYLMAATAALDATGPQVEAAYDDAVAAHDKVEEAYQSAKGLAAKIAAVAKSASAVASLVGKALG